MTVHVRLDHLTVEYDAPRGSGRFVAVADVNLEIARGTFVTIVGPSGCGKSTVLLAVAGLTPPTRGRVIVDGRDVTGPGRDRAMVFQEFALMPWRTAVENVRFGLELQRWSDDDRQARAQRFVRLVGLEKFEHYRPHQLSGGMRQRVGIARALAVDPQILLLDEPFGALDAQTREAMGDELLGIWEQDKKTALFVTHSIDEAVLLGDAVVVMSRSPGRVIDTIAVDLPRPRTIDLTDTPAFVEYRRRIRRLLGGDAG